MARSKAACLSLGLVVVAWALSGLAGAAWRLVETSRCYLFLPEEIRSESEIAAAVDGIYAAVRGLWLPGGPDTEIPPPFLGNVPEEVLRKAREE